MFCDSQLLRYRSVQRSNQATSPKSRDTTWSVETMMHHRHAVVKDAIISYRLQVDLAWKMSNARHYHRWRNSVKFRFVRRAYSMVPYSCPKGRISGVDKTKLGPCSVAGGSLDRFGLLLELYLNEAYDWTPWSTPQQLGTT